METIICLGGLGIGLYLVFALLYWGLCRSAQIGEEMGDEAIRAAHQRHAGDL